MRLPQQAVIDRPVGLLFHGSTPVRTIPSHRGETVQPMYQCNVEDCTQACRDAGLVGDQLQACYQACYSSCG